MPAFIELTIRIIEVPEEGCKGETGTVRVSPANKKLFPNNTPPAARRARSNAENVGRRNGEINLVAARPR